MKDAHSLVFTVDDVNYRGGAHVATLQQVAYFAALPHVRVTVLSLTPPGQALLARLPAVRWLVPRGGMAGRKRQIRWLLKQVRPGDTVCVPFENSVFRGGVARLRCRKKIQWFHIDYAQWRLANGSPQSALAGDAHLYAGFDQLVFVSRQARHGFLRLYPQFSGKCAVCHNLLGEAQVKMDAALPLAPGQVRFSAGAGVLRLVTVARLNNAHKGIGRCLLAADALRRRGYAFEWLFIGGGEPEEAALLRGMARELELGDSVRFAGHLENPFPLVAAADVCCQFSYYEGIANTVFEAMMVGTPVIATAVSGVDEQLAPGQGWVVENRLEAIIAGLESLLGHSGPARVAAARAALAAYQYPVRQVQEQMEAIMLSDEAQGSPQEAKAPAVSVVVLAYNVAAYLQQCLASLAGQTLADIEVLVVNDGSTDASGEIIDAFVQRYPGKFYRLDKENGGPGPARNHGLAHARGDYVAFVDGDDWVEAGMLQTLLAVAVENGCDIVQADLYGEDDRSGSQVQEHAPFAKEGLLDRRELMRLATRPVVTSACTKLYRRALFAQRAFPGGWYEDLAFLPVLLSYAQRVYYLPMCLYHYRWHREGSIQNSRNDAKTRDIYAAMAQVLQNVNPAFAQEAAFSVYDHCCRFYDSQPDLNAPTLAFLAENQAYFIANPLVRAATERGELPRLCPGAPVIPPVLYYCGPLPMDMPQRLAAWQRVLPGFELRQITAAECPVLADAGPLCENNPQKRAEIAAYAGCQMLVQTGGLYVDVYTELAQPMGSLLGYSLVAGFETHAGLHTHVLGASRGNAILAKALARCEKSGFPAAGSRSMGQCLADVLVAEHGLQQTGAYQILPGRAAVFPASWLAVDVGDGRCAAAYAYEKALPQAGGLRRQRILQDYFQYPVLRGLALKQPLPGNGIETDAPGLPYEVVDRVIGRYGAGVVLRQLAKALLRFVLPGRWYQKLEDRAM
ncbi:MAG: glycosyltransferase [Ruminococcaceae bacterium]|nr:glycosyltransferase [Oscillospiraceae bacterium]